MPHPHTQGGQGSGKIFALQDHMGRYPQMDGGKIPDGINSGCYSLVAAVLGMFHGDSDHSDADMVVPAEGGQLFHRIDGFVGTGVANGGIQIKTGHDVQTGLIKAFVVQQGLA